MTASVKHLAIIMDGNGRWAQARGLPRAAGHKAGLESVRAIVRACRGRGIPYLTLFAFSSENWRRPKMEVRLLMDLFMTAIKKELDELTQNNVRIRFVGDISAFEQRLQHRMQQAEFQTAANTGLNLNIAVNYGGRWDIVQAAQKLAQQVETGQLRAADITAELLAGQLSMADAPEPDLLIRTSGELRISNFLIWQSAYSELYFTDCLWPDFGSAQLDQALEWFGSRERRFGCTAEQVAGGSLDGSNA